MVAGLCVPNLQKLRHGFQIRSALPYAVSELFLRTSHRFFLDWRTLDYLDYCCNPQDAFHKVEDSYWEGQSPLQSPSSVLGPWTLFYGYYDLYMSQSSAVLYWCPLTLFYGHNNLSMS